MEQSTARPASDQLQLYIDEGFKPIFCHGYSNGNREYQKAKVPISNGYTDKSYVPPTITECLKHISKKGWMGWLVPEGVVALDIADGNNAFENEHDLNTIQKYVKRKGIEPGIHKSKNGYHYLFKGVGIPGDSKGICKLGLYVTYRVGGKNQLILYPAPDREWINYVPIKELPEIPRGLLPYSRDDRDDVLRCLAQSVGRFYRDGYLRGWEDVDAAFVCFLIAEKVKKELILDALRIIFDKNYDEERSEDIYERAMEKTAAGEPVMGAGSFVEKVKEIDGKELLRFIKELSHLRDAEPSEVSLESDTILLHPSYHQGPDFMSLGFKINTVEEGKPHVKDVFFVSTGDGIEVYNTPLVTIKGQKCLYNLKGRTLLSLGDKWPSDRADAFRKNPTPPEGVYESIKMVLRNFVEFQDDEAYGTIAAWIIATYFNRIFYAFPYLHFYGKKTVGKSRVLNVLKQTSFNAIKIKGVTEASLGDTMDGIRGTLFIDQAEMLSRPEFMPLVALLADGYTQGGGNRRVIDNTSRGRTLREFESYGPKGFASIRDIDEDLKDRCIQIIMVKAFKDYEVPYDYLPIWGTLRDSLYRLALMKWREVESIYQTSGGDMTLRVRELWKPLDTILTLEGVDEDEHKKIKKFFLLSMDETQAGLSEYEERIISTIKTLLEGKEKEEISASDIVDKMGAPEDKKERRKMERGVGWLITRLALASGKSEKKGNKHKRVFELSHIDEICKRYDVRDADFDHEAEGAA